MHLERTAIILQRPHLEQEVGGRRFLWLTAWHQTEVLSRVLGHDDQCQGVEAQKLPAFSELPVSQVL